MSCKGIKDSLGPCLDAILGIREGIGAELHRVFILTRVWQGGEPGDGHAVDEIEEIKPCPAIVDYSHNIRLVEAGAIKQGDLLIKHISKHMYSSVDCIDCSGDDKRIQKFYYINEFLYQVINVKENLLTWDVQVRKTSDQETYLE